MYAEAAACPKCGLIECRVSEHFARDKDRVAYKCPRCGILQENTDGQLWHTHIWYRGQLVPIVPEVKLT